MDGRRQTYDVAVKTIPKNFGEKELRDLFEDYGEIAGITLVPPNERYSRRMAFVRFVAEESVSGAIAAVHGRAVGGDCLRVEKALPRRERVNGSERSFGNSYGSRGHDNSYRSRPGFRSNGFSHSNSAFHSSSSYSDEPARDIPPNSTGTRRPGPPSWSSTSDQSPAVEEELNVMVVSLEANLRLWVQVDERGAGTRLKEMTDELQAVCAQAAAVKEPVIGTIYGGLYASDQKWYRCQLLRVSPNGPEVQFIDFGNCEVIRNEYGLVELPDELSSLPKMARPMVIAGVPYPVKKVSGSFLEKISGLILEKDMLAVVKGYNALAEADEVALSFPNEDTAVKDTILQALEEDGFSNERSSVQTGFAHEGSWTASGSKGGSSRKQDSRSSLSPAGSPKLRGQRNAQEVAKHASHRQLQEEIDSLKQQLVEERTKRQATEKAASRTVNSTEQFTSVLDCVTQLRTIRQSVPGKVPDSLQSAIEVACDDSSKCSSTVLADLLALEQEFDDVQAQLVNMAKGEELTAEIAKRNRLRRDFHTLLVSFLEEVQTLPVEKRLSMLQTAVDDLLRSHGKQCQLLTAISPPADLTATLARYKHWRSDQIQELKAVQETTDASAQALRNAFCSLEKQFDIGCTEEVACPDIDHLTKALAKAISAEKKKTDESVNDKGKPHDIVKETAQGVLFTLRSQQHALRQLCEHQRTYTSRRIGLEQWLDAEPDISSIEECRHAARTLRSEVRHKMVDVEESNECDVLQQEIDLLLLRLHEQYNTLDQHLRDLLELLPYFPELPALYPQLSLNELKEGHGFVKEGRQIEHYRLESAVHGADVPSYLTKYAGEACVLQEFVVGKDVDAIKKRIFSYAECTHPCLQSVSAIFFDRMGKKMFVQLPFQCGISFEEWLASQPSTPERYGVMLGVLTAIGTLHSGQVCHGTIHPRLIRVVLTERGTAHPILMAFNFKKTEVERARSVDFPPPEVSSSRRVGHAADIYAFGLLMMSAYLPQTNISTLTYGADGSLELAPTPQHPHLVNFLKVLLHHKPSLRLTAAKAMAHPFIAAPPGEEVPPTVLQGHDLTAVSCKQLGTSLVTDASSDDVGVGLSRHNFWESFLPSTNLFVKTLEAGVVEQCLLPRVQEPFVSSKLLEDPCSPADRPVVIDESSSPLADDTVGENGHASGQESVDLSSHQQEEFS